MQATTVDSVTREVMSLAKRALKDYNPRVAALRYPLLRRLVATVALV
jgi:hypothetical protein